MKLFSYNGNNMILVVEAFNRGHACKQIAKYLEREGRELSPHHLVKEIILDTNSKGSIHMLDDQNE